MLPRDKPLPFASQPFPEEPLGGWLGRVASYYRMGIDELSADFGLDFRLADDYSNWLCLPRQSREDLDRLEYLTHVPVKTLRALEVPKVGTKPRAAYRFCRGCLFVNPENVFAPRWIKAWLGAEYLTCPAHGAMEEVTPDELSENRNFGKLLKLVSKENSQLRERRRKRRRRRAPQ